MADDSRRESLLGLLERIHRSANELQGEVTALHENIRFDHRSPSAKQAVRRIESEVGRLTERLGELWEAFEQEEPS